MSVAVAQSTRRAAVRVGLRSVLRSLRRNCGWVESLGKTACHGRLAGYGMMGLRDRAVCPSAAQR